MNLNELDFIIEQLENLPNKKFVNQKIIYERQKRNKKQEDEDFLAELEAKAETDQQKDIGRHSKMTILKHSDQKWPFFTNKSVNVNHFCPYRYQKRLFFTLKRIKKWLFSNNHTFFSNTHILIRFLVDKTQNNEPKEPKTKYVHKIKRQPPPLVQDLRPEVLGEALIRYFLYDIGYILYI